MMDVATTLVDRL